MKASAILTSLVLLGIALRAVAYFGDVALGLDEVLLGRNVLERSMRDLLFAPLGLDQVAPRGFLFVEKLAVLVFGPSELALRLFPFLSAVASVVLFRRVVERLIPGLGAMVALALFAIGVPFLKFGAEVKQYSVDATATILLTLLALHLIDPSPAHATTRRGLLIGASGFIVIVFSQASVLVMAGIGVALAGEWLFSRNATVGHALSTTIPLWAIASVAGIALGVASMTPSTREFMADFWSGGFAPLRAPDALPGWYWQRLLSLFSEPILLRYAWPMWFLALAVLGGLRLARERRLHLLIVVAPIVMTLVAATAQQYPFRQRLVFFLLPSTLILVAAGADWLRRQLSKAHAALGVVPIVLCLGPPIVTLVTTPPPYETEQTRVLLGYLQQHRQAGDAIYVYPLARVGVWFYGPAFGVERDAFVTAVCDRDDTRAYLRDADQFRGRPRVWLVSGGQRAFSSARASVNGYFTAIGTRRDSLTLPSFSYGTVTLELWDLSDPTRLGAASAATFPAPPMPTDPRPGCRPWTRPGAFNLK